MRKVRVGFIGTGFIAKIHYNAFRQNFDLIDIVGVCSGKKENAIKFAKDFNIPKVFDDYKQLCESDEIDIVDICTPTNLHDDVIMMAAKCKKHIICEKPLTGYFGEDKPQIELIGNSVTKNEMYKKVQKKVEKLEEVVKDNKVQFMYAENFVYAPAVEKMKELIQKSRSPILELRSECSHSGSIATYSKMWKTSGGGSLMRLGSHPIGLVLHLKEYEGLLKYNKPIKPKAVFAEIGNLTKTDAFLKEEKHFVVSDWKDVEDWSVLVIDFDDNTKATVFSTDISLGGVKNWVQAFTSKTLIYANITPNDTMVAYTPDEKTWADVYISEKIETKTGWSFPSPDDFWTRGYPQEMRDFALSFIEGREPLSGFNLAKETSIVIYAGYLSAEEGRKIYLK